MKAIKERQAAVVVPSAQTLRTKSETEHKFFFVFIMYIS
jgi:hypothetical protein